jgi:hypothetical protein
MPLEATPSTTQAGKMSQDGEREWKLKIIAEGK